MSDHSLPPGVADRFTVDALIHDGGTGALYRVTSTGGESGALRLLDPELTVSLPANITAWTGIDAVAHALEAVTARSTNAAGTLYGHQALRILAEALPRAVADGSDIEARGQMLWASTVAGLALHNCNTHLGHNISHALGSLAPVHHGLATGLALEVAIPWLAERSDSSLLAAASAALGGAERPDALPDVFATLMRNAGIAGALPGQAADVSQAALAEQMKTAANRSMAGNAIVDVTDTDIDTLAGRVMALPLIEQAA